MTPAAGRAGAPVASASASAPAAAGLPAPADAGLPAAGSTPGEAPAAAPEPAPGAGSCVVCAFVGESVERRLFFVFAEALGAAWFLARMRRGGFCLRHARRAFRAAGADRLAVPYRELLRGRGRLVSEAPPAAAQPAARAPQAAAEDPPCVLCESAGWAERHALWLLAEPVARSAARTLGAEGPVCATHLDGLLDLVPWWRTPEVAERLREQLDASGGGDLRSRAAALAGVDLDADLRDPVEPGWAAAAALPAARVEERIRASLERGRCPACDAGARAAAWPIAWLADPPSGDDTRDVDRLCRRHLHDAVALAPGAAEQALAGSRRRWQAMIDALPAATDLPARSAAARLGELRRRRRSSAAPAGSALDRLVAPARVAEAGLTAARRRRERACTACQSAATAVEQMADLLGSLLGSTPWRAAYERSEGLCLRHAGPAVGRLGPRGGDVIGAVAEARARRLAWELDECLRLRSWSVRYERGDREADAWARAMAAVLGESVAGGDLLGPDGDAIEAAG